MMVLLTRKSSENLSRGGDQWSENEIEIERAKGRKATRATERDRKFDSASNRHRSNGADRFNRLMKLVAVVKWIKVEHR